MILGYSAVLAVSRWNNGEVQFYQSLTAGIAVILERFSQQTYLVFPKYLALPFLLYVNVAFLSEMCTHFAISRPSS